MVELPCKLMRIIMNMEPQDLALSRFIIKRAVPTVQAVVAVSMVQVSHSVAALGLEEEAVLKQMTRHLHEVKAPKATLPPCLLKPRSKYTSSSTYLAQTQQLIAKRYKRPSRSTRPPKTWR